MVITTLLSLGLLYLAYRIIRNGFARPQSDKLNLYGVFGAYLIFWLVAGLVEWLVQ